MSERRLPGETATILLEAGAQLADSSGLATLTVDAIVAQAGTGKGTFYRHFANQDAYFLALHEHFVIKIAQRLGTQVGARTPGLERLQALAIGYLDACIGERGLKSFLTEARVLPALAQAVETALGNFSALVEQDYAAIGWPKPRAAARLFVAMAHETALAEQRSGRRDTGLRSALLYMGTTRPK